MDAVSDEALLAGLAAGDPDAASAFVDRFQRRVFGLASTIVRDRGLAEDVAQEALLRAWRHAANFDPRRGSVTTWILAITRNLSIDTIRVRRPTAVDPASMPVLDMAAKLSPDETPGLGDDVDQVRAAMADVPEEQQRALVMAGLLGYTAREIAEIEDIPLGTAKTRIRTGLLRVRRALQAEDERVVTDDHRVVELESYR